MITSEKTLLDRYEPQDAGKIDVDPQVVEARISPSGVYLAAASYDARVRIWSLENKPPRELSPIVGHNGWVHSIAFHPTESILYSADSWGKLKATRIGGDKTQELWVQAKAHEGWIRQIDISPDGTQIASVAPDKRAVLWSATNGEILREFDRHKEDIHSVRFDPTGKILATGDEKGQVRLWDVMNLRLIRQLDASALWLLHRLQDVGGVRVIRFNHDGSLIACAGVKPANGGTIQGEPTLFVFDVSTGEQQTTMQFGEAKDCQIHDIHWTFDNVMMAVTCGTPGAGKIVFHRPGDEKPFFETTKFPNCQSLSYHSQSNLMAVVTTNRNSNGNGRRLNKEGEYEGNNSPIQLFKLGKAV
ncbi:MAG: hypothetical protein ABL921_19125 [Pirellula sp.]